MAAEPASAPPTDSSPSVEALVRRLAPSVVVIRVTGRDGRESGIGTGFVVDAQGLIATNLHVIGEARPIGVELADGRRCEVTAIEATDRVRDLAVLRVAQQELKPLELGDSSGTRVGQAVVALGNPQGLEHSVVTGVVSGQREIDGMPMLQLAIPIEPGNSGGPLVDMQGRVLGIVTMKSAVTENLGFALEVDALKPLLEHPNPVPMARWLTIGALDPRQWQPLFGARWQQRAGRIRAEGAGSSFGGRSLCLGQQEVPQRPYEVAVNVKLDDESGAAGLVFDSDGAERHYGFYPSGGKLRLSRFDGPNVLAWKVLQEVESAAYRPGDWNTLKVRRGKQSIECFVNDELVITSDDNALEPGRVGLAKFRETVAEFRGFRLARELPDTRVPEEVVQRLDVLLGEPPQVEAILPDLVVTLVPDTAQSTRLLRQRADLLERQAIELRKLAVRLHRIEVLAQLQRVLEANHHNPDNLLRAALLVARLDNEELDVEAYLDQVEQMAGEIRKSLPAKADDAARLAALNRYLFEELGFHGSRGEYYHRANSYLNEVIDDREGLPITLSVLYIDLATRLGLSMEGVGLPGHFVVRFVDGEEAVLIDVFDRGRKMSDREAELQVAAHLGRPLRPADLAPMSNRAIIARMLRNLLGVAMREQRTQQVLDDLDALLVVDPDAVEERSMRAVLLFREGRLAEARADVDWLLENAPAGIDIPRLLEFRKQLTQ